MYKKTVFVIGAGASKEAKLPTGFELKDSISRLLDICFDIRQVSGDHLIADALQMHVQQPNVYDSDINPYLHEAWHIRDILPHQAISIDNFINNHRDNEKIALCGKLAIVRSILEAEKKSLLYFEKKRADSNINYSSLEKTWYIPFFQILTENCSKDDLKKRFQSITLIIFNYDRCVEHFLFNNLQAYFRMSEAEATDLVQSIKIYHPYGSVGSLPWLDKKVFMEFGSKPSPEALLILANEIKTFSEEIGLTSNDYFEIQKRMSEVDRLVFMGFAFHDLNMELIAPDSHKDKNYSLKCYATTFGLSESDKKVIRDQINGLYNCKVDTRMSDLVCGAFFTEYWRSLAF